MSTSFQLLLPRQLLDALIAQAQTELPNECCGLLAGTIGADGTARVTHRYPLMNVLASPIEYESEPKGQLAADKDMRRLGIEVVAIYHSHPTTDPIPSRKDRARYDEARPLLGEVVHFIVGLRGDAPDVRAWWLTADDYREAEWEVV